jgi:hypothetical protein
MIFFPYLLFAFLPFFLFLLPFDILLRASEMPFSSFLVFLFFFSLFFILIFTLFIFYNYVFLCFMLFVSYLFNC